MAMEVLILVAGSIIQEEALPVELKFGFTGFTALNGWFKKCKARDNVKQFSVVGEDGEINAETLEG